MKDYKRLTNRDLVLTLNYNNGFEDDKRRLDYASRLWELENRIESGELVDRNEYLDYLMAAKNTLELTYKEIEFFAKHNARVRENANAEIARLTAENDKLKKETAKEIGDMLLNEVIQSVYTPDTEIIIDKQFLKDYMQEKYGVCLEEK